MGEPNGKLNGVNFSNRVHEWEAGLPNVDDITPLSYGLLSPELLSAFNIKPEPYRTSGEVTQASEKTLSSLRGGVIFKNAGAAEVVREEEDDGDVDDSRRNVSPEDADSAAAEDEEDDGEEKAAKRARLVWTSQLHRRFVDVVAHLGIKNAVPKTIMQLMNVEGLTRENVASHLQKYRLYLKRNQGFSFETAPSAPSPVPTPPPMQNNHYNYSQNNNNNNNQYQFSNGVMQTGNNMYGSVGVSYHQNHLNHHHNMQK